MHQQNQGNPLLEAAVLLQKNVNMGGCQMAHVAAAQAHDEQKETKRCAGPSGGENLVEKHHYRCKQHTET